MAFFPEISLGNAGHPGAELSEDDKPPPPLAFIESIH